MVLVILAGITLNAVIGEDGIIFQAKDTKNMITNETEYDNEQLAALQNELRDNQLYTGIGIIPGTDTGGSSEGGENGSSGGGNQGGSNSGGTNTNTGGSDGSMIGGDAVPPTITVLEGEEIAASFFRSDVTIQIATTDKTLRIKYILTTTVDEINNELYPSGLIKEIDIENGGTLTFTKDGEYTITAYSYDLEGKKSNSSIMWLKRETGSTAGNGVTVSVASGNMGQNEWYTSNITLRVLGTDTGSSRVTYRVRGTAYSNGTIGNTEYQTGEVDTGEVDIANGTTFRIAIDGEFAIVAYTYDAGGMRLSTAPTLNLKRDSTRPVINSYIGEQTIGSGFKVTVVASDAASNLASSERYTYRHKLAPSVTYTDNQSQEASYTYAGLDQTKTYDMYVIVKDEAGNITTSDLVSKPALWVSSGIAGETYTEGRRSYYRSDVTISLTGQDENNVDISRVTYQIAGTTTGAGNVDGTEYSLGVAVNEEEREMGNIESFQIQADGNWEIKINTYNKENVKVTTNVINITRDTVGPEISEFSSTEEMPETISVRVIADDALSGITKSNTAYQYYQEETLRGTSDNSSYQYTGLTPFTTYLLKVIVCDKAGNISEKLLSVSTIGAYLVDVAEVGDYVEYNAVPAEWDFKSTATGSNGQVGWHTEGANKGSSITGSASNRCNYNGWRVMSKVGEGSSGTVTIVSAGIPFAVYAYGNNNSTARSNAYKFSRTHFLNPTFTSEANIHPMSYSEWSSLSGLSYSNQNDTNTLTNIGCAYWVFDRDSSNLIWLLGRYQDNTSGDGSTGNSFGIRVVITLHSGVTTTNNKTYDNWENEAWQLLEI